MKVYETFIEGETPKTKDALKVLRNLTDARRVLVVLPRDDDNNWLSLRNEPTVHLLVSDQLNTYDVLLADQIVFTVDALNEFLGGPQDMVAADSDEDEDDADDTADDTDEEA